jgi:RNA polymerase sigma-70 factor (ECF subfamily)
MMSDAQIIDGCARHDRRSQQELYNKYSRFLLGICLRYASDRAEAEDILQEVFLKIYFNITDYSGTGSFSGWLRKVTINMAINHYHRNLRYRYHENIDEYIAIETGVASFEEDYFTADELYKTLNELPSGYRMVFNLYAVEGYKHKEIAEMLNIDTNTSKSQYSRAKTAIRNKLEKLRKIKGSYSGTTEITDNKKQTD